MTTTYTVADCSSNRELTVTGADRADALRLVYETLVRWNDDQPDCGAAIAQGYVETMVGLAPRTPVSLDSDPAGFWFACAELMLTDNQDFAEGEGSPFSTDDDA